jgi:hypothetical protein
MGIWALLGLVRYHLKAAATARRDTTKDDRLTQKSRDPISETPGGRFCVPLRYTPPIAAPASARFLRECQHKKLLECV